MPPQRILAISSSRVGASGYLEAALPLIDRFLSGNKLEIAFIPFASVDKDYKGYLSTVRKGLSLLDHTIRLAEPGNAKGIIEKADVIMVGGGNTFKLMHDIYALHLVELIRDKINGGTPYIGWSAGSNITGRTICTTNDMPIIEPESFKALNFFPFQINPHYFNIQIEGQHGETRDQRLTEFIQMNPGVAVVGLPEGTALQLDAGMLKFMGDVAGVLFGSELGKRRSIEPGEDVSFLMRAKEV